MAAILQNPFMTLVARPHDATETAVASLPPPAPDVTANSFPRGFDPERFAEDIEPLPIFLAPPIEALRILASY